MGRVEQVLLFWKEQDPSITSMHLRHNAEEFDEEEKAEVMSYLPPLEGKEILELASGIGRFTHPLSQRGRHVTAVDFAPQLLQKNQKESPRDNISFLCCDVMNLSFSEKSFDFIFFNWLLMYLEDDEIEILIQRVNQWLKPGGELFFRESCALKRFQRKTSGYYATYRTLSDYDTLVKSFSLIKEGSIQTYIHYFADPFQAYWHCQKPMS